MCLQNLKFVALPVPELIGVAKKFGAIPGYAHTLCSPKCLPYRLFHSFSRDFRLEFQVEVANPNIGESETVGGRGWYR